MSHPLLVSGESVQVLLRFLELVETGEERNGLVSLRAENIPTEIAVPLLRATMRREARLLLEDANSMGEHDREPRTPRERRADAIVDVLLDALALVRYSG